MAWTACVLFLQLCLGLAVRDLPSVFLGETVVFIVFLKHVKEFCFLLKVTSLIKIFLKLSTQRITLIFAIFTITPLTFKNSASYIWDGRNATLQMLHFIYFFQQI